MRREYAVVVDTDSYSGNFEREMCAYLTGQLGECGVGKGHAELYHSQETYRFDNSVVSKPDEHGVYRPCEIWTTPGFLNDGYGNHMTVAEFEKKHPGKLGCQAYQSVAIWFAKQPTKEETMIIRRRLETFGSVKLRHGGRTPKVLGVRVIETETYEKVKEIEL